jgi:hypothetical protein
MVAQSTVTKLSVELVRKPATSALKFKNRKRIPFHRLPFVDAVLGKIGLSFWAVPKTGNYFGGFETGNNLARIYLKYLRENGSSGGGTLPCMVLDMFDCENTDDPSMSALRGQVVGFFSELESWVAIASRHSGDSLDHLSNTRLLEVANNGLNFDNESYFTAQSDEDEKE